MGIAVSSQHPSPFVLVNTNPLPPPNVLSETVSLCLVAGVGMWLRVNQLKPIMVFGSGMGT